MNRIEKYSKLLKQIIKMRAGNKFRKTGWVSIMVILKACIGFEMALAQYEPMFTQYMFNEMFINPAYAGSRDNISATLLYRNQWVGIEGAPKTQTFSVHAPLGRNKTGVGLAVMNEEIGVTHQLSFLGNYAYRIVTQKGYFSMGIQAGLINHQEKLADINAKDQGDPSFSANTPKLLLPNAGMGLYYYSDKFYIGLSVPRFIENKVEVSNGLKVSNKANFKNFHYYLTGAYVFKTSENVKLKPSLMIKAVQGAPVEFDLNLNVLFHEIFWIGSTYRTGDAVALLTQVQITRQFRLGYSYDYTLTKLGKYNSGSHEITLGYDFNFRKSKVVTPRYF